MIKNITNILKIGIVLLTATSMNAQERPRDLGIKIGILSNGKLDFTRKEST